MIKKISMQHIADRLGLSKFSVSQALSGKPGVSEETRERVIEMAKALGYKFKTPQNNITAANLPDKPKSFVFIWITPEKRRDIGFWDRVISGIIDACQERNWDPLILSSQPDVQQFEFPPYADRSSCLGAILLGHLPESLLYSIREQGLQTVLADHYDPFLGLDCVVNDNFEAARTVCHHLIASKAGSIVFVGDDDFSVSFSERRWGCQLAVMAENEKRSLPIAFSQWTIPYSDAWRPVLEAKVRNMPNDALPDSFICANDQIALSLITFLQKYGYSVPETFRVAGFDNIDDSAHSTPPLTTVDFGKELLGRRTVETLERRIAQPASPKEKIVLTYRLVNRGSG